MLERTKTRPIEDSAVAAADVFRVVCPAVHAEAVKKYLAGKGCALEELVSPALVFPERSPATLLRGIRNREGLTQQQLAVLCGISRRHISEMENSKRAIGKRSAEKLGSTLKADPRLFL